jgi:hypothetical protein
MGNSLTGLIEIEELRVRALEEQDAKTYSRLCSDLGLSLDSVEDRFLYEQGAGLEQVEEEYFQGLVEKLIEERESLKSKKRKGRKIKPENQIKYNLIVEAAEREGIDVDDIFANTSEKKEHLRKIMGYNGLRIGAGFGPESSIPLNSAKPERVGEVYKQCFYRGE